MILLARSSADGVIYGVRCVVAKFVARSRYVCVGLCVLRLLGQVKWTGIGIGCRWVVMVGANDSFSYKEAATRRVMCGGVRVRQHHCWFELN